MIGSPARKPPARDGGAGRPRGGRRAEEAAPGDDGRVQDPEPPRSPVTRSQPSSTTPESVSSAPRSGSPAGHVDLDLEACRRRRRPCVRSGRSPFSRLEHQPPLVVQRERRRQDVGRLSRIVTIVFGPAPRPTPSGRARRRRCRSGPSSGSSATPSCTSRRSASGPVRTSQRRRSYGPPPRSAEKP